MVVPQQDATRWIERLRVYANANEIEIVSLIVVADEDVSRRDLLGIIGSGQVDAILCAFRGHVPEAFPIVAAAEAGSDTPPQYRRPQVIRRSESPTVAAERADSSRRPQLTQRPDGTDGPGEPRRPRILR